MATPPNSYVAVALKKLSAAALNLGIRDALNWLLDDYPRAHMYRSTAQSIPNAGSGSLILYDAEVYDNDTMHSTSVNTSRCTFTTSGLYSTTVRTTMAGATYTQLEMATVLNGAGVIGGGTTIRTNFFDGSGTGNCVFTFDRFFTAGDYIETFITQTSGGARNTGTSVYGTSIQTKWIAKS